MQIACENIHTGAIAEARVGDGGLTWRLDPDHFTARLAQALAALLSKIACHWCRVPGTVRPVDLVVSRTRLPGGVPAVVADKPGLLSIALDAGQVTEQGAAAFEAAMGAELAHWYQLAA